MPFDLKFILTNNNITCTLRMALLQINNLDKCDNNKRERKKKKKEKEVVDEQLGLHGFESYYFNNQVKCADEKNDLWPVSFYNNVMCMQTYCLRPLLRHKSLKEYGQYYWLNGINNLKRHP